MRIAGLPPPVFKLRLKITEVRYLATLPAIQVSFLELLRTLTKRFFNYFRAIFKSLFFLNMHQSAFLGSISKEAGCPCTNFALNYEKDSGCKSSGKLSAFL